MEQKGKSTLSLHLIEAGYSLVILVWVLAPLALQGLMPVLNLPFRDFSGAARSPAAVILWSLAVFLPLAIAVWKAAAFFLDDIAPAFAEPHRPLAAGLSILESALAIGAVIGYIFEYARMSSFFSLSSPFLYLFLVLSVAYNAFFIYVLISSLDIRDESFREYRQYKMTNEQQKSVRELILQPGIQKRLLFSFVPLILCIILVLTVILMSNFATTILGSVIDNGKLLAEQTATVIKTNPADKIAAEDYLFAEAKKNSAAAFPFLDISYYQRAPKASSFSVAASTDKDRVGGAAADAILPFVEPIYRFNSATDNYEFLAPVNLSKAFLGYIQVDYSRDVIFASYFRTQVKVVGIAAIFIYLSVLLTYLIGRNIVFPILYLRMSVATIAQSLSGMIKGEKRISPELLQYKDRVETRDEIKSLSSEVGNMAAVIRGIVPYISASTLKHSERSSPMTESKEQCFLFTDIRGFTTLSEGMTPEKVVEMLNHYLDIQSSIILANHGDVDKFVGDEVMAVFEGSSKELNAVKTAMEIRKAMAVEKEKAIAENKHVVSIGIGINSGPVVFGSVGAKDRMDFTSIGDTVNLAARLEGANKAYGTKTLVTEAVYDKVKEAYLCREVDKLTVKGKKLPVSVYEIVQAREIVSAHLVDLATSFEQALALYRAQKWDKAEKLFKQLAEKYNDDASNTFLGRIALFKASSPGASWDGVFNMTVK
jgi:class 3 adenylate cyclase